MCAEKLLLIGTDAAWLERWGRESDVRIVGIVDPYKSGKAEIAVSDIPMFDRLEQALASCQPDYASIVTPPDRKTDLGTIRLLVEHGLDVLLQKLRPAAADDGEKLLELAETSGRSIVAGEAYRYDKEIDALRYVIESGWIGAVGEVRWVCRRPQGHSPWMGAYEHVMLEDLTYHHMGALQRLIGLETEQVHAWSEEPDWSVHPHTSLDMILKLKNGVRVNYTASWTAAGAHTSWLGGITIDGADGTVTSDRDGVQLYRRGERLEPVAERFTIPEEALAGRSDIISEFLASRRAGRRSATDIRSFIQVTRLLRQARRSAEHNRYSGEEDGAGE